MNASVKNDTVQFPLAPQIQQMSNVNMSNSGSDVALNNIPNEQEMETAMAQEFDNSPGASTILQKPSKKEQQSSDKKKPKKKVTFFDDIEKSKTDSTDAGTFEADDFVENPNDPKWKNSYERSLHCFKKQKERQK